MKIAVFRALQLGDMLCAIPAIRTIKKNFPQSQLYIIGLAHMRPLLLRYPFIDRFIPFPGYPGLPEQEFEFEQIEAFVTKMCDLQIDMLYQMHGNGTIVNDLLKRCEARRLVGFCPDELCADRDWMVYPDDLHEVDRHLKLLQYLGLKVGTNDREMEFPLFHADKMNFENLKNSSALGHYVIVHVGSRSERRQWPLENFTTLAHYVRAKGRQIVLTGTAAEEELVQRMELMVGGDVVNLAGKTDVGTLGMLVKQADMLICNCTGISHIAAALKTKSIVISLDGEPERWGPQDTQLHFTYNALETIHFHELFRDIDYLLEL